MFETRAHGIVVYCAMSESTRQRMQIAYGSIAVLTLAAHVYPFPVYIQMSLITLLTIFLGSHHSLHIFTDPTTQAAAEQLTTNDVYMVPVMGSAVLLSLYAVFKFLPAAYVNMVVKAYFFVFGSLALATSLSAMFQVFLPSSFSSSMKSPLMEFPVPQFLVSFFSSDAGDLKVVSQQQDAAASSSSAELNATSKPTVVELPFWTKAPITGMDICCGALSLATGVAYLLTNLWSLSNLFGLAFSIQGISLISLGTVQNGLIMLWGLFVYDITWVFGSDVMVTVAKNFDAPIKLLFPRGVDVRPSMLGLGDIVVPGIFMALMLRLDKHNAERRSSAANADSKDDLTTVTVTDFEKPYFWSVMVGYFVGLSITVGVMYWFEHAQPALLYLVPTCCGSVAVCALVRGEFKLWFNFSEEIEKDKKDEAKKDD